MRQIAQNYRTGVLEVVDVPAPALRPGGVLVQTSASLISAGTERGKVALARKSLLAKARERPDAVRQVLNSVQRDGIAATYRRVLTRLDRLTPIGYSAAGTVSDVGVGVTRFRVGDRVAVGGAGYANHAESLWVPQTLVVPIPNEVSFEEAAFATVASIALHGLRLAAAGIGENVAVIGLGLLGQLTVRLARVAGCRVLGCDLRADRIALARAAGAVACQPQDFAKLVHQATGGSGADVVLITAAAKSSVPLRLAGDVSRDRAKVVAVGDTGLDIPRELYYRKELSLIVSRSYGPGRYDPAYEEKGTDYPIGYVRWTEGRNLAAVLDLIAERKLAVADLISSRFPIGDAGKAYESLLQNDGAPLAVVLEYPPRREGAAAPGIRTSIPVKMTQRSRKRDLLGIGFVGIGSFASNVLLPALERAGGTRLVAVASASGLSAKDAVRRHGFQRAVGDALAVANDPDVDAVFIATPHNTHAELALMALEGGKAVFVEKPAAIDWKQLALLREAVAPDAPLLVGFNRRFSPHTRFVAEQLAERRGSTLITVRVNAGAIPRESSLHDAEIGGGRLVGEGCHFVDLCACLIGAPPETVSAVGIGGNDADLPLLDNVAITLAFPDGSVASVLYTSKGDTRLAKERVEVFCDGWAAVIDNFDESVVIQGGRSRKKKQRGAKGHTEEVAVFLASVRAGAPMPISINDLWASSAATLAARDSLLADGERIALS